MRHYANRDLQWRGDWLCLRQRKIVQIVRDQQYPSMWRIRLPDGTVTDMLNRSRVRDATRSVALTVLSVQERAQSRATRRKIAGGGMGGRRLEKRRAAQKTRAARKFFQSPSLVVKRGRETGRLRSIRARAVPPNGVLPPKLFGRGTAAQAHVKPRRNRPDPSRVDRRRPLRHNPARASQARLPRPVVDNFRRAFLLRQPLPTKSAA